MNGLNYLLQTNLYLVLFMGFYVLVLRNETFFRHNRIYLNASVLLSFAIPFINSPWFRDLFITQKVREAFVPSHLIYETIVVSVNEEANNWTVADILLRIYISGTALLLVRFFIQLILLNSSLKFKKGSAFSFFKILVVDKELPQAETIINHEKVHIRQWHSADVILIELASIISWFNPVVYLYKKEIRHIHEFIADEEAVSLLQSKADYAVLLFSNTMGIDPHHLSNNFFNHSLLKRRIIMLNKNKSRRTGLWKYGFSAPLFALMLIVSAASVATDKSGLIAGADKLISPLENVPGLNNLSPSEASYENPESLNKPTVPAIDKDLSVPLNSAKNKPVPASSKNAQIDYTALKEHIQRNIKYPASAKQNNITGYVMVNFKIQNQKVTNVKIAKGLQNDVDNEVLRTFSLFTKEIQVENNNYSMAIVFKLIGIESEFKVLPLTGKYYFLGSIVVTAMAGSGKAINNSPNDDNAIKDFASVEVLPEFEGGMKGWSEYLRNELKYPAAAKTNDIQGRVILSFIANKDGSLSDIKVLRGLGHGTDEEAVRVVKNSPKWKPGLQNGQPVRVAYTMPIFFQLPPKTNN